MRLPSVDELRRNAAAAFRRFPFTISAGMASALIGVAYAEEVDEVFGFLTRSGNGSDLLVATTLALPLFFALRMAQERGLLSSAAAGGLRLAGVLALGAVVWVWPDWSERLRVLHYLQLSLGFHLLAAYAPFIRIGELNGFWQYNRSLFLRFLLGALYSAVLFIGLAVALLAIDNLFGIDIDGSLYGDLFMVIGFAFQTWFFTAGIPGDLEGLDAVEDYPRGLKLFSQYVLIPLVSVYLLILTAYLVKVVVTTEWPSGWIGWLVSGVSVAGILSILLTHPIREHDENKWIVTYGRWFWIVMLPAVGMLLVAVWKRISQYGITEPRYVLLVLTLWLAAMAVLYGFTRSQNIKLLPATLALLAFVTLLGPWGAYAVSERSQVSRLEGLLERNGMLSDGRVVAAPADADSLPLDDRREIGAALAYVLANYGADPLVGVLGPELAVSDSLGGMDALGDYRARDRAAEVMDAVGLSWVRPGAPPANTTYFQMQAEPGDAGRSTGYDYAFVGGRHTTARVAGHDLRFDVEGTSAVAWAGDTVAFRIPLADLIERGIERTGFGNAERPLPRDMMQVAGSGPGMDVLFLPHWISGSRTDGGLVVDAFSGLWLVRVDPAAMSLRPVVRPDTTGKIRFDLAQFDDAGLRGPPDGRRTLTYEFCMSGTPEAMAEIRAIDPTVEIHPGAAGRVGCSASEALAIGHTGQPDWRDVLDRLAERNYVGHIEEFFGE